VVQKRGIHLTSNTNSVMGSVHHLLRAVSGGKGRVRGFPTRIDCPRNPSLHPSPLIKPVLVESGDDWYALSLFQVRQELNEIAQVATREEGAELGRHRRNSTISRLNLVLADRDEAVFR
jgi:hypothetical protein